MESGKQRGLLVFIFLLIKKRKSMNLHALLKEKKLVYVFREFLHEVYNNENLSFWLEIEIFKSTLR